MGPPALRYSRRRRFDASEQTVAHRRGRRLGGERMRHDVEHVAHRVVFGPARRAVRKVVGDALRVGRTEGPEHVLVDQGEGVVLVHSAGLENRSSSTVRNRVNPVRMRFLTVPSGVSRRSAICACE